MASSSQKNVLDTISDFSSAIWNDEIGNIYSLISGGISVNISNGSITQEKLADNANPAVYFGELFGEGAVVTSGGFAHVSNTGLNETITGGTAYVMDNSISPVKLIRVTISGNTTHTVLDNTTNYLDLDVDGSIYVTQSAAVANTRMRILKLVASGGVITSEDDEADRTFLSEIIDALSPKKTYYTVTSAIALTVAKGVSFRETTNKKTYTTEAVLSLDITNSVGALGLDQGTEGASKWYALVGLGDPTETVAPSAMLVEAANYDGTIVLPSPYTQYGRIGWVRNDGSSDLLQGDFIQDRFIYDDAVSIITGATNSTFATADCSAGVPPTCRHGLLLGGFQTGAGSGSMEWRITGSAATTGHSWAFVGSEASAYGGVFPMDTSQQIDYKGTTSISSMDIDVDGWIETFEEDS